MLSAGVNVCTGTNNIGFGRIESSLNSRRNVEPLSKTAGILRRDSAAEARWLARYTRLN
jgi:hypothetical protein